MISVPNHLQQLSGNKVKCFLLLTTFLVMLSCGGSKKIVTTNQNPEVEEVEVDMDLPVYPPVSDNDFPVAKPKPKPEVVVAVPETKKIPEELTQKFLQDKYKIALALPFLSSKMAGEKIPTTSVMSIDFANGFNLGLQSIPSKANIKVHYFDTEANIQQVKSIQPSLMDYDLILGGVTNENVKELATFALQNKKVYLSPINPSSDLSRDNPFYVQLTPDFERHITVMFKHITATHSHDQIVILAQNNENDKKYVESIKAIYKKLYPNVVEPLNIKLISNHLAQTDVEATTFFSNLSPTKNAVIIPSWKDQTFINSVLRKLSLEQRKKPIVVYGMPQWKDKLDNIDYSYFEKLNVHISSLDKSSESQEVKNFEGKYFSSFGDLPSNFAYKGYNTARLLVHHLNKSGKFFQFSAAQEQQTVDLLDTKYTLTYKVPNDKYPVEEINMLSNITNSNLYLLEFKEYRFQLAD